MAARPLDNNTADPRQLSLFAEPPRELRPSRRVLVVEDNPDSAHSLVMLLTELGHEVHLATNGEEALETVFRIRPQFVFLDLGLPGVDGFYVCERIKQEPALQSTRVVAVTGYGDQEHQRRALAAGFDSFVAKPAGVDFYEDVLR